MPVKKFYLLLALLALPALAFANTMPPDPAFQQMFDTVMSWSTGPLGTGLATTMLLMGGAIAVAKNTPMPALTGVMGAAFLHFGPSIMMNIMGPLDNVDAPSTAKTAQVLAQASKAPNGASAATVASASAAHAVPASTTVAATTAAALPASTAQVAVAATEPAKTASSLALTDAQLKKAVAQAPELASVVSASKTVAANPASTDSKSLTSHSSSLAHTVPVPEAVHPHAALKAPAVSSSQVTKWVGLGGAAIILTLLGLLMYMSAQRRARATGGFTPGSSTPTSTPTSVFSDPHGFKREKRSPTFGHESP
jgi:conjugal transfer pilus assembly protein TraA